jgi:short-subunit dehydrogenase
MFDAQKYGPWAVIAGASEGVGESFARELGRAGINLVLIARKQASLDQVAQQVRAQSAVQVRTLPLDLTSPDILQRVRTITDDVEVGLLVYVAGANQSMQRFFDAPLESALRVVRLNPVGQVSLSYHFGKKMSGRGRGGIILIGSLAGYAGATPLVAYCASKAFTQNFAEGLWSELRPHGVDALYVPLGAVATPNRERQRERAEKGRSQLEDDPNKNVMQPDDVAAQSLEALPNGPILVPKQIAPYHHQLTTLPRREASELMRKMLGGF